MDTSGSIARFAAIFAGGTLISRALGLVRDMVIAALIPTVARDMFLFAFRLPNMLRDMFGEGAANAALIPVFASEKENSDPESYRQSIRAVLGAMVLLFAVITALGVAAMPYLPHALERLAPIAGGKTVSDEQVAQTILIAQWTFPYLFLIGVAVFAMGPLFVARRYGTPSWSPALLNVALIACAVLLHKQFENPAWALVIGVWVGGLAQLVAMFAAMYRHTGVLWPSFRLRAPAVSRVLLLLCPVIIGQAAGEVNKLVDNFFAYALEDGVVTALFYANRLVQLPLAVFGIAISVAILPGIAAAASRHEDDTVRRMLRTGFRQSFFLICPAMIGLIVMREPIVSVLFERGAFGSEDSARTAAAMAYYGAGLLAFAWVKVSVQGFYGQQKTVIPVAIASFSMLLNIILNFALVGPMGFRGLALATTISFTVNFILLFLLLCRQYGWLIDQATAKSLATVLASATAMGAILVAGQNLFARVQPNPTSLVEGTYLLAAVLLAALLYFGVAIILRLPELQSLLRRRG